MWGIGVLELYGILLVKNHGIENMDFLVMAWKIQEYYIFGNKMAYCMETMSGEPLASNGDWCHCH